MDLNQRFEIWIELDEYGLGSVMMMKFTKICK
jgi:hypothetical protein